MKRGNRVSRYISPKRLREEGDMEIKLDIDPNKFKALVVGFRRAR